MRQGWQILSHYWRGLCRRVRPLIFLRYWKHLLMQNAVRRSIPIVLLALLIPLACGATGIAHAQSGSAGGSIGNDEKSLSGSRAKPRAVESSKPARRAKPESDEPRRASGVDGQERQRVADAEPRVLGLVPSLEGGIPRAARAHTESDRARLEAATLEGDEDVLPLPQREDLAPEDPRRARPAHEADHPQQRHDTALRRRDNRRLFRVKINRAFRLPRNKQGSSPWHLTPSDLK